jgi:hypothetical protein
MFAFDLDKNENDRLRSGQAQSRRPTVHGGQQKGSAVTQDHPEWLGDLEPDWVLSPYTGWTRDHWLKLADHLLLSLRPYASPGHGRITPPGAEGGYGHAVDGLEGFARSFLLAGFRLAGTAADPLNLAEWYAQGLKEGTDDASPNRWVKLTEHPQAKVEAASLAIILDLTRDQIWDRLDAGTQERLVQYLAPVVGDTTYPRNNWLWFRIAVETFLRSVGGPWSQADIEEDLALHDSFVRSDGWLADGDGRDFDHYTGWALQLYPTLWQRMRGARDLADDARRDRDARLLDRYLQDARYLVGADGGPLIQGRSLIYRTAAAAPFWTGALAGVPSVQPGQLRRAASGIVSHFARHGAPGADGLYTMGWFGPWRHLAQSYSGPGSPYWAAKGFLGLALPADHPAWTDQEQPLPIDEADFVHGIAAPGWAACGTVSDGLVRVVNHGTDHAHAGDQTGDSPLYARLGYSTATYPLLDETAWTTPLEMSVALIDGQGRASHRAGFAPTRFDVPEAGPAWLESVAEAHWLDPAAEQFRHGSGYTGRPTPAGRLTVVSVLTPGAEVRGVKVDDPSPEAQVLRIGGWPTTAGDGLAAAIVPLTPGAAPGVQDRGDASPLGPATVKYLDYPVQPGQWVWTLITLGARRAATSPTNLS